MHALFDVAVVDILSVSLRLVGIGLLNGYGFAIVLGGGNGLVDIVDSYVLLVSCELLGKGSLFLFLEETLTKRLLSSILAQNATTFPCGKAKTKIPIGSAFASCQSGREERVWKHTVRALK